jgi:hypothetical protein
MGTNAITCDEALNKTTTTTFGIIPSSGKRRGGITGPSLDTTQDSILISLHIYPKAIISTVHIYPRRAGFLRRWASFRHLLRTNLHIKTLYIDFLQYMCIIIPSCKGRRHARVDGKGLFRSTLPSISRDPGPRDERRTIPKQTDRQ